jgi:hypothetical protein
MRRHNLQPAHTGSIATATEYLLTRRSLIGRLPFTALLAAAGGRAQSTYNSGSRPLRQRIALINDSSAVIGQNVIAALQRQLDEHFSPAWGISAELYTASDLGGIGSSDYYCLIVDEVDTRALGMHSLDDGGRPFAKIFMGSIARDGGDFTVVLSHEILEMLADPWGNIMVLLKHSWDQSSGDLYKREICDPVQDSIYQIDGVDASNFLLPAYFQKESAGPYDLLGILPGPFSNSPHGWVHSAAVYEIQPMS